MITVVLLEDIVRAEHFLPVVLVAHFISEQIQL